MAEGITNVTDDDFEQEVLKNELPVIVDLWAVWCAPCRMIEASVENIAQSFKDKLKVVKLNVDENPKTPANYGVMSIPTLLFFKGGELKETIIGAVPQNKIEDAINKHL